MAEHELCKLGVTGSNPVASTPEVVRCTFQGHGEAESEAGQRIRRPASEGRPPEGTPDLRDWQG